MRAFQITRLLGCLLLCAFAATFFAGCSSTPKVDWNSRVGVLTYDEAIGELGPPDKQAKLSDGKTVAEWITRRRGSGLSIGAGTWGGSTGVGVSQSVARGSDAVLRLTFDTDGKLSAWTRN